ncbi:unnamed protein product [Moneuplotes crassus]|uniref:DNA-PKcs N-terminal domain-containing protein n=1 Tax=Euplotes crassus TaxID=5936 RepID=A0AAD2D3U1_EUPCR|nr:unnamed protein product [Moneuplotes crassus]
MEIKIFEDPESISSVADSEQAVNCLKDILFGQSLTDDETTTGFQEYSTHQLAYSPSWSNNTQQTRIVLVSTRKKLVEVISEYIEVKHTKVYPYLEVIINTCLRQFSGDCSTLVKEAALHPVIQIMRAYEPEQIKDYIDPAKLIKIMLDEIKLQALGATLKATIWEVVGWLHKLFPNETLLYRPETQDVMMSTLIELVESAKFEIKHMCGLLRGFTLGLHDCVLEPDKLLRLFQIAKVFIEPRKELSSVRIQVEAMTLISTHSALFKDDLRKQATEIINMALNIGTKQANQDVREASGELLAQVAAQVADFDDEDEDSKETAKEVIDLLTQVWNEQNEHSLKIEPTVKAVGILSKGIRSILGEDTLRIYLEKLMFVEMNTYRIVEEFGDLSNPETEVKKFKVILKKQKQMISILGSYAHFVTNMDLPPGERECQHFFDLALTATRNFRKLYVKWRPRFLEALASLIMALHKHQAMFIHWIAKFVKQAIGDIITSHAGATQAELEESLDDSVHFWKGLIEATKEINEPTCVHVYDALLNTLIGYFPSVIGGDNVVLNATEYDKHSNAFLSRLTDFMILLLPNCESQWFARWYPNCVLQIQKLMRTHESSKIYLLMVVPLLTVSVEDLTSPKNHQISPIIQRWITTTALPQLGDYKSGFLTIGTSERNKHILLDFVEKVGQLSKTEKSRKEIFEFLFSFIASSKEGDYEQDDEKKREAHGEPNIDLPNARKGRAMAIKKLRAAKQNLTLRSTEKSS